MSEVLLVDTGPLVAFLNRDDRFHAWSVATMKDVRPPLHTCEAVLSEACFLLRRLSGGSAAVLQLVERGLVVPSFRCEAEAATVRRLLERYDNLPMSFADACLVRMAELHSSCRLITLDADFRLYRRSGRQVIPLLAPSR